QAHLPATGELAHRQHPLIGAETQAGQQLLGTRGGGPGIGFDQGVFQLGNGLAIAIGRVGAFFLQGTQAFVAVDNKFAGRAVTVRNSLAHTGHFPHFGDAQVTPVQIQLALQQGKQRGFTCAVLAHNAQALARIDDEIRIVQQDFDAATQRNSSCAYHRASCSRLSKRIWSSAVSVLSQIGSSSGKAATKLSYSLPISNTSTPSGDRKLGAASRMRRTRSMPSSPPARASCGSCWYSLGRFCMDCSFTYGGLQMIRS